MKDVEQLIVTAELFDRFRAEICDGKADTARKSEGCKCDSTPKERSAT